MPRRVKIRLGVVAFSLLLGMLFVIPTLWPEREGILADITPSQGARLGLDLQGGMYLVLGVEVDRAVEDRSRRVRDEIRHLLEQAGIEGRVELDGITRIRVEAGEAAEPRIRRWIEDRGDILELDRKGPGVWEIRPTATELRQIRDWAVSQSLSTIRNRIDQYGIAEPTIQRQGDDRIVVQLPGVDDPRRAIELIGRTAQLTFHMYRDDLQVPDLESQVEDLLVRRPELRQDFHGLNEVLAVTLPTGVAVRFQRINDGFAARNVPVLVDTEPMLTGDTIVDARVRLNPQFNEPYVAMEFDAAGGRRFEEITSRSVGKRFAIVLDETVFSAPVIRERIPGGRASIEGQFTMDEARDLAIVLRAGALAAPARILEERSVGPSLGQDSIRAGVTAILVGSVLVLIFMMVYYRYAGFVADVSLVANMVFLLGILGLFGATLTLPGLAGIVLTIGMAIDGNVIIFERIREELRAGRGARASVEAGYAKALSSILDANITTLIAALVLFQFGTGPVRGFAVTLSVGILTTLFSVLFVSRTLIDAWVLRRGVRNLPI